MPTGTLYFKAKLAELDDQVEALRTENSALVQRLRDAEERRVKADIRTSRVAGSVEGLEARLRESERGVAERDATIRKLQSQVEELLGMRERYEAIIAELMEKRIESLSKSVEELGKEFEEG